MFGCCTLQMLVKICFFLRSEITNCYINALFELPLGVLEVFKSKHSLVYAVLYLFESDTAGVCHSILFLKSISIFIYEWSLRLHFIGFFWQLIFVCWNFTDQIWPLQFFGASFFLLTSHLRLCQWKDDTAEGRLKPFYCHNILPATALQITTKAHTSLIPSHKGRLVPPW